MRITRGQLRRIVKEELGGYRPDLGRHPTDNSFDASPEFDRLVLGVMEAARRHGLRPYQVIEAVRQAVGA